MLEYLWWSNVRKSDPQAQCEVKIFPDLVKYRVVIYSFQVTIGKLICRLYLIEIRQVCRITEVVNYVSVAVDTGRVVCGRRTTIAVSVQKTPNPL